MPLNFLSGVDLLSVRRLERMEHLSISLSVVLAVGSLHPFYGRFPAGTGLDMWWLWVIGFFVVTFGLYYLQKWFKK
jgi:hypothetical protein